ncbi:MAG TPA: hypothetical protein VFE05_02555 [Longimicrobiaceae bacterium]|jgi:hypothetical protein|nr:hypothetical protein [Longimicrobiaceae bacterium]
MRHIHLIAPALLALAAGCAGSRMVVPGALAPVPDMEVHGAQGWMPGHALRFGGYAVRDLHRGSRAHEGEGLGGWVSAAIRNDRSRLRQTETFRFRFAEGEVDGRAECEQSAALSHSKVPVLGSVLYDPEASLGCAFTPAGASAAAWRLDMSDHDGRGLTGILGSEGVRFQVARSDRLSDTRWRTGEAVGFVFLEDGHPVGSVDVVNGGRVRIDPGLPQEQRFALAAASAAILLRTDLATSVEDEA